MTKDYHDLGDFMNVDGEINMNRFVFGASAEYNQVGSKRGE